MSEAKIITKGKVLGVGKSVSISWVGANTGDKDGKESKRKPHPDLLTAFSGLNIHAAYIAEFLNKTSITVKQPGSIVRVPSFKHEEDAEIFITTGFTLDDQQEFTSVILTAHKILSTGEALGFNTPPKKLDEEGKSEYPYWAALAEAIEKCRLELDAYIEGKVAPEPSDNQGNLFEQQ